MTSNVIQQLARDWCRLGVLFAVPPAGKTPDLERLLLQTAQLAPHALPQFLMAVTWLSSYGDMVARQRLARMTRQVLEPVRQPALGLLLSAAVEHAPRLRTRFAGVLELCAPAQNPGPLSIVDRQNIALVRLAEQEATPLSKLWGLWMGPIEIKTDALRPAEWVSAHNPELAARALTGGDLVASVLAEAQFSGGIFDSELELARRCGASRPAIRDALHKLRLSGYARQERHGRAHRIIIEPPTHCFTKRLPAV